MRVLASISLVACLGAGCTTVVGTSDFYVVSGGGGSGAGSEGGGGDGAGGSGTDCADGEFSLTVTCPLTAFSCELNGNDFTETMNACLEEATIKVHCDDDDDVVPTFGGCTELSGSDTCLVSGSGSKTVTVDCD